MKCTMIRLARFALIGAVELGCAVGLRPVTNPATLIDGNGFSLLPPQGPDWYIKYQEPRRVVFQKELEREGRLPMDGPHTFIVGVMVLNSEGLPGPEEFVKRLGERLDQGGRFSLKRFQPVHALSKSTLCVEFDATQEERQNPHFSSLVLEITIQGFVCRHPTSSEFVVHKFSTERRVRGDESLLDDALKREAAEFLKNVTITPS